MPSITQILYKEAKANKDFKNDLLKAKQYEYTNPKFHGDKLLKNIYLSVYIGWMIGKGVYDEKKYS